MSDNVTKLNVRANGEEALVVHGFECATAIIQGQYWLVDGGKSPLEAMITIDPVKRTITMDVPNK